MRLISLSDRTRFQWPLPSLTPCLALPLVRPGCATSLGAFSSEEQVRSPRSLGPPTSDSERDETRQGSLRAEAGLPVKLLPPTLSPGQAWPGLWEEQGRPSTVTGRWEGGKAPHHTGGTGRAAASTCSHSLPPRSDPGLPACQSAGATHSEASPVSSSEDSFTSPFS